MTTTKTRTKQREDARKAVLERKEAIDAELRLRDAAETDNAVDFRLASEERDAARQAETAAEVAMGHVVNRLIGKLRISYARASELLELSPDELRRLRQLALDAVNSKNAANAEGDQVANPAGQTALRSAPTVSSVIAMAEAEA